MRAFLRELVDERTTSRPDPGLSGTTDSPAPDPSDNRPPRSGWSAASSSCSPWPPTPASRPPPGDLGLNRISVRLWRDRWLDAAEALAQAEKDDLSDQQLLGLIEEILDDAPRPGGPATFSPEQIVQIVAVACEPPEKSGRPISHWTHRELADEVKKRQIVKDIAPRTVGRFLKTGRPAAPSQPLLAQRQPA